MGGFVPNSASDVGSRGRDRAFEIRVGAASTATRSRVRLPNRVAVTTLMIVVLGQAPAIADTSREEVLAAIGVNRERADVTVMVDTSASMEDGGRYGQVAEALRPLLAALAPHDHLSLLTFDAVPALRFSGAAGGSPDAALAQLPPRATGPATDVGAVLAAALAEMERPDANVIRTTVLVTDGRHDPPPGSAYPGREGVGWTGLATRASNLAAKARVNAYALALGPDTDAALLKQVFPNAVVVALPTEQLGPFLTRIPEEIRLHKAREVLAPDIGGTIDVSWGPEGWATVTADEATLSVQLTFRSTMETVPLELRGLTLRSRGLPVRAVGLPERFELAAGQARVVTVHIDLPGEAGELRSGLRRSCPHHGPPSSSKTSTSASNRRSGARRPLWTSRRGRHDDGLGVMLIVLPALVLLLVGATVVARQRSRPPLTGSILVSGNDGTELDQALEGRSMRLPLREKQANGTKRRITVRGARRVDPDDRSTEYGITVVTREGEGVRTDHLWPGDSVRVGESHISYMA